LLDEERAESIDGFVEFCMKEQELAVETILK